MCGIFGFVNYGKNISEIDLKIIYDEFSKVCNIRGNQASGISYVDKETGKLVIKKEPKEIIYAEFDLPENIRSLMAHCRLAVEENQDINENNHPFWGETQNHTQFSLAHNGILVNLNNLRIQFNLPVTDIETDSYVVAQLLSTRPVLDIENLKNVCEKMEGSFAFSILDQYNNLYLSRGDVPIFLVHFKELQLYAYISTRDLFEKAILNTKLDYPYKTNNVEISTEDVEVIHLAKGDLVKVTDKGILSRGNFSFNEKGAIKHNWYLHHTIETKEFRQQLENLNNR